MRPVFLFVVTLTAGLLPRVGPVGCQAYPHDHAAVQHKPNKSTQKATSMLSISQQVTERLKLFADRNDLDALAEASSLVRAIQAESVSSPTDSKTLRTEKLTLEFAILNQIDAKLKRDFNFDDVPSLSVSPPPETGLPSGVDPASISDPKARASYEQAIAANQQKAAHYRLQKRLHKIDKQATEQTMAFISHAYSRTPEDINELNTSINKRIVSDRRKAGLEQFVLAFQKHS